MLVLNIELPPIDGRRPFLELSILPNGDVEGNLRYSGNHKLRPVETGNFVIPQNRREILANFLHANPTQ